MSLLQINKKAVTEEDAQRLVDRMYQMNTVFGTPVQFIKPEDFSVPYLGERLDTKSLVRQIKKSVNFGLEDKYVENMAVTLRKFSYKATTSVAKVLRNFHSGYNDNADQYDPSDYKQPNSVAILAPPQNITWNNFLQSTIKCSAPNMPKHSPQIQSISLLHEFGHVIGCGEPQADAFKTTMYRRLYANISDEITFSDFRAAKEIIKEVNKDPKKKWFQTKLSAEEEALENAKANTYGWGVVEGNDYIRGLAEDYILGLSKTDIKNIRFQKFDHHNDDIEIIGAKIRKRAGDTLKALDQRYFPAAAKVLIPLQNAAAEIKKENSTTDTQHQMLTRFQLACQRISIGAPAYERPKDFIDPDILESERAIPITFKPGEYIPE